MRDSTTGVFAMMNISKGFWARMGFLNFIAGLLALALLSGACSRQPAANERGDKNGNTGNTNQAEAAAPQPPLSQPTLRGDIERASYAITSARDVAKQKKWQEALTYLINARHQVESAISRQPRLKEEFEALKSSLDRAISAAEGRGKDAEARIDEAMARVTAIRQQVGQ